MSRRLLQKGRYPKAPTVEQITSTSNSQFPPNSVPTTQMGFYDPNLQAQNGQNSWNQPAYPNPQQTPFPNPVNYHPNQVPPSQPDVSNYWSTGQMNTAPIQAQWNESWGAFKPDNIPETNNFPNYMQQPQPEQWPQSQYPPLQNQNYHPQSVAPNYNQMSQQQQEYQPSPVVYQPTNNPPTVAPGNSTLQREWENGALEVSQPENLPWIYGAPQYSNSVPSSVQEFTQNATSTINTPSWPSNSNNNPTSENPANSAIDSIPNNYLLTENIPLKNDPEIHEIEAKDEPPHCKELENSNPVCSEVSSVKIESVDSECEASALSAFFQSEGAREEAAVSLENASDAVAEAELSSPKDEGLKSDVDHAKEDPDRDHVEENDTVDTKNEFVQEEQVLSVEVDQEDVGFDSSSPGNMEEPINQEVPEPHQEMALNLPQAKQIMDESSPEEPPNQQIPSSSGQTSRSTSSERERLVIRPREGSPFKPPSRSNSSKGAVVQQELPDLQQELPEAKPSEGKTVVQEVNLETFPDNLETPSDYEELRKQSPLYSAHKHLRSELNSSPSSLLCDNLDIPSVVTLAPAAPPLSSSKSDKSESSTDSKSDSLAYKRTHPLRKLDDPNYSSSSSDVRETYNYEKSKNKHTSRKESVNSLQSRNRESNKTLAPVRKHHDKNISNTDREENSTSEMSDYNQPLYLKDSKITGGQLPSSNRSHSNQPPPSSRDSDHPGHNNSNYPPDQKLDPRYRGNHGSSHPDSEQSRFAEQKYPSFDERHYFSDRERSRPSSRNSLKDDYPYRSPRADGYYPSERNDPRHYPPEYPPPRPSSRSSESELTRHDRQGPPGYYQQQQQHPYGYPPSAMGGYYPRNPDYYQRPNQRGYEYDPYQRDPYYSSYYSNAYRYGGYSNYNYGFYDELYRNDPRYKQYQEQYRQYYAKHGYDIDYDRSSVHSGRSSANELSKDTSSGNYPEQDIDSNSEFSYNLNQNYPYDEGQQDSSNVEADQASTPSSRLTPVKFSYAHPIARFSPGGLLIVGIPSQSSTVPAMPIRIQNLQGIREDEDSFKELKSHQGPLVRNLTHKNDVIEFCTQKIKCIKSEDDVVDRDSHILLWELMVLLLRQNGSVAGTDIAELLLRDHEVLRPPPLKQALDTPQGEQHSPADANDSSGQSHPGDASSPDEGIVVLHDRTLLNNTPRTVDVDKVTRKFREFLLFGHKKDALEWAMKHGLWGHALFLASKMDVRTYANVMTRFANSLALNDPLQTLYQLMSGRQPLAVTNVADKRWGDWRPHLAMILSNPSGQPDVDSRSITTLGDTLASRGCLCAAHFCYIMAQVEFGTYEQKNNKLVLLSADHSLPFEEFASNEAIQLTEIYEYALSLANPLYLLVHFQLYKFLYSMRLIEHGFIEEALHYCEIISGKVQEHPQLFQLDLVTEVYKLASLLKYYDPHFLRGQGEFEDQEDPEWLKNLSSLVQNFNNLSLSDQSQTYVEQTQDISKQNQSSNNLQFNSQSSENVPFQNASPNGPQSENNSYPAPNYYQPGGWNQQTSYQSSVFNQSGSPQERGGYFQGESFSRQNSIPSHEENETTDVPSSPLTTQTPSFDYYPTSTQQVHDTKPLYEASHSYGANNATHRERRDSALSSGSQYSAGSLSVANKKVTKEQKPESKKDKTSTQAGKTWLGGIFSRLLPRGPNQMILPDDKNPTIVWDEATSRWMNKDSNEEDENNAPVAPPTDTELMGSMSSMKPFHAPSNGSSSTVPPPNATSAPASSVPPPSSLPPPTTNKFQRPKTRGMRQNYVDVLSASGATKKTNVIPEGLFPTSFENNNTSSPTLFFPSPTSNAVGDSNSTDFESGPTTFSSSQFEKEEQPEATPLMFDPSQFDARSSSTSSHRGGTIGRSGRRTYPT